MIICYCIDSAYKIFTEISIQTVKKHNPGAKIVIVSEKPIQVNGADEYYVWDLGGIHRNRGEGDRISNAAYLKLLLPRLPYDKVLFLDGDVICQHPLDNLWNMNIEYIGVTETHSYGEQQSKELGVDRYALSGFLLLNLKNLRKINFIEESFKFEKENSIPTEIWRHEETILNCRWHDKLTFLDTKFHYCYHRNYKNPVDYKDVYLMHFPGKDKSSMINYYKQNFTT